MEIGGQARLFNLSEARALLPLIKHITSDAAAELKDVEHKLQRLLLADPRRKYYQEQYKSQITRWKRKMERLGLVVASLWCVQFDVGDGYLCWQHPELVIGSYRAADTDWDDRLNLHQFIEETDPDWAYD